MNLPSIPLALRVVLVVLSIAAIGAFLFTALARIGYPYELEYMTGACLDHVDRILDGKPVYVEPSAEFVTWLYGPLYFYVCAGVSWLVGESSLPLLRAVSLSCAAATTLLAFVLVRRVTGNALAATVAAGTWASTYGIVGTWWDIARVDSMFVLLMAGVLTLLWTGERKRTAAWAGVLMTVAYMAKQNALVVAPPFAVGLLFLDWRRSVAFVVAFAATLVPSVLVLDLLHDGWFSFYTWEVPRSHGYSFGTWWQYFPGDSLAMLPMILASAWYVVRLLTTHRVGRALFVGAWCSGVWLAACLARAHLGGAENSVIPAHFAFAIVTGLAIAEAARDRTWRIPIALLATAQFACSAYDPWHYLPTAADEKIGDRLVEVLEATPGPIMMPVHGHWARRTGHGPAAHVLAMMDVWRGPDPELADRMRRDYFAFVRDRGCQLVILNEPEAQQYMEFLLPRPDEIDPHDGEVRHRQIAEQIIGAWEFEPLFDDARNPDGSIALQTNGRPLFTPVVGLQTRPKQIWRRKH